MALRSEVGADVPAAEWLADLGQIDVLILHQDAGVVRLLGQRQERIVARVAHHRDAVWLRGDCLAQLVGHLADVPARKDVVHRRRPGRPAACWAPLKTIDAKASPALPPAKKRTLTPDPQPVCRCLQRRGVGLPQPTPGERQRRAGGAGAKHCSSIEFCHSVCSGSRKNVFRSRSPSSQKCERGLSSVPAQIK